RSGIDFSTTFPISTGTVGTAFLASAWAPPLLSEQAPSIQAASSAGAATARILAAFEAGRKMGRVVTLKFLFTASAAPVQAGTRHVADQLLILRSFVCTVYGSCLPQPHRACAAPLPGVVSLRASSSGRGRADASQPPPNALINS